jgi:hypothetical protein
MRRDTARNRCKVIATGLLRAKSSYIIIGSPPERVIGISRVMDISRGICSRATRGADMAMRMSIRLGWVMEV